MRDKGREISIMQITSKTTSSLQSFSVYAFYTLSTSFNMFSPFKAAVRMKKSFAVEMQYSKINWSVAKAPFTNCEICRNVHNIISIQLLYFTYFGYFSVISRLLLCFFFEFYTSESKAASATWELLQVVAIWWLSYISTSYTREN